VNNIQRRKSHRGLELALLWLVTAQRHALYFYINVRWQNVTALPFCLCCYGLRYCKVILILWLLAFLPSLNWIF